MAVAPRYSPEVIKETQRYWEEQAGVPVSEADAEEIITNIAGFFDLLAQWEVEQRADADRGERQAAAAPSPTEAPQPQQEDR